MTTRIQIADSRLSWFLSTNRKPRVTQGGEDAPDFDWLPDRMPARVTVISGNATMLLGTVTEYSDAPRGYTLFMHDLREDGLKLTQAIPVRIDKRDSVVTAYNPDIEVFGIGSSELEAMDDFRSAVGDLYWLLRDESEANLGPVPSRQLQYMRAILKEE